MPLAQLSSMPSKALKVDRATGLTAPAAERLRRHGPNRMSRPPANRPGAASPTRWHSPGSRSWPPAWSPRCSANGPIASVIFGVVAVNAALGYWQEAKAADAWPPGREPSTPSWCAAAATGGASMPAIWCPATSSCSPETASGGPAAVPAQELQTDESMLTGESLPTAKHTPPCPADTGLADRSNNMAYAGTTVVAGQGLASWSPPATPRKPAASPA